MTLATEMHIAMPIAIAQTNSKFLTIASASWTWMLPVSVITLLSVMKATALLSFVKAFMAAFRVLDAIIPAAPNENSRRDWK